MEYASYMVRVWRVSGTPAGHDWQAEVENVQTGERRQFPTLDAALRFLHSRTTSEVTLEHDERDAGAG